MAKQASKEPSVVQSQSEIQAAVEARRLNPDLPDDLGQYSGKYKYLPTGEIFALKVLPDNEVRAHKTHTAKNQTKFWDGTAEEFRRLFDKEG